MPQCFGVSISIHWSVWILVLLIAYSLAEAVLPSIVEKEPTKAILWTFSFLTALLFFVTIGLHELAHVYVAKRCYNVQVRGITFWMFGGISLLARDVETPGSEFVIAVVGPLMSGFLAGMLLLLSSAVVVSKADFQALSADGQVATACVIYLGWFNLVLAVFNLIPMFPVDGGRMLRAAIWKCTGSKLTATRVAAFIGIFAAFVMVAWGIALALTGRGLDGLWLMLLGLIVGGAAWAEYQQVLMTNTFASVNVGAIMTHPAITVPADVTINDFLDRYVMRYKHSHYPVVEDGKPVALAGIDAIHSVPRDLQHRVTVRDIIRPLEDDRVPVLKAATPVSEAMMLMNESGRGLVVDDEGNLVGILTARDIAFAFSSGRLRANAITPLSDDQPLSGAHVMQQQSYGSIV